MVNLAKGRQSSAGKLWNYELLSQVAPYSFPDAALNASSVLGSVEENLKGQVIFELCDIVLIKKHVLVFQYLTVVISCLYGKGFFKSCGYTLT